MLTRCVRIRRRVKGLRTFPLYWDDVADSKEKRDAVLTYDCQHFYERKLRILATVREIKARNYG